MNRKFFHRGLLTKSFLISILGLLFFIIGCKKKDVQPTPPQETGNNETSVNSNVHLIDTNQLVLVSSLQDLQNGLLIYQGSTSSTAIPDGHIIVDPSGDGLLRKVISSSVSGNQITYVTSQGNFTDAFNSVSAQLSSPLKAGWSYDLSGTSVYSGGGYNLSITSGSVEFNPNINLDFDVTAGNLTYLNANMQNAPLTVSATISASASGALQLASFSKTIATISKKQIFMVGWLPVIIVYKTDLVATGSVDASSANVANINYSNSKNINCGVSYSNTQGWQTNLSASGNPPTYSMTTSSNLSLSVNFTIAPIVSVKLYSVAGVELSATGYLDYVRTRNGTANWNESMTLGIRGNASLTATIFDETLTGFSESGQLVQPYVYESPKSIAIFAGNNQSANAYSTVTDPLKVIIKDSEGVPVTNAKVLWEVVQGNGTLSGASSLTNANGVASILFTLGNTTSNSIKATILDGNGQTIGTPQVFTQSLGTYIPFAFVNASGYIYPNCSAPDSSNIALYTQGGVGPFKFSIDNGNSWFGPSIDNFLSIGHHTGYPLACGTYYCKAVDNTNGSVHDTIVTTISLP